MMVNSKERKGCRRQITLGTLRSEDGDGGENVAEKVNSRLHQQVHQLLQEEKLLPDRYQR